MPLGPYMMGCAVVLLGEVKDAAGAAGRGPIGTGFFVRVPSESNPDKFYGYLLTAHHVVKHEDDIELQIPRLDDPAQYYALVDAPTFSQPEGWERLDLALAEFAPPPGYMLTSLQVGWNVLPELSAGLAMPFHYVGYLEPLDLVMARSGTIGKVDEMLPDGDYLYRTHVGDVRSYGGFSGSPCFVEIAVPGLTPSEPPVPRSDDEPVGRMDYVHLLCGMFTGHIDRRLPPEGLVSRHGVGFILSSNEIWGVLMSDELRDERRMKDAEGAPDDVRMRTSVSEAGNDEFQRFEDLTRRLVQTPRDGLVPEAES